MKTYSQQLKKSSLRSQRGLSLIELMISITIGLLILVSLTTMFVNQTRARAELDKANRMIDNGRYALEVLSSNIRMAGFFDSYNPTGAPTNLYDPCTTTTLVTPAQSIDVLLVPVQGYDASSSTAQIASPPCSMSYSTTNPDLRLKAGSDIIAIRRLSTAAPRAQATLAEDGTIYMQVSTCEYDAPTNYRIGTTRSALQLGQRNILGIDNCKSELNITTITDPRAPLRPFLTEVYFISPENRAGDGIPTLKRRELTRNASNNPVFVTTPMVEGIEFMQVEYGIDNPLLNTDGIDSVGLDGAPDYYTSCSPCTNEEWSNVVTVKLHLIARNTETTSGYSDPNAYALGTGVAYSPTGTERNYKRHAYTQSIRLTNVSARREVP